MHQKHFSAQWLCPDRLQKLTALLYSLAGPLGQGRDIKGREGKRGRREGKRSRLIVK